MDLALEINLNIDKTTQCRQSRCHKVSGRILAVTISQLRIRGEITEGVGFPSSIRSNDLLSYVRLVVMIYLVMSN